MLPRQPYTRSGAWYTVPHPGHGGTGWDRVDHRVGQVKAIPARRSVVVAGSCLYTNGHGQHLLAVARMPQRRLEACATGSRHGEHLQPGLKQRDMWVMHRRVQGCRSPP